MISVKALDGEKEMQLVSTFKHGDVLVDSYGDILFVVDDPESESTYVVDIKDTGMELLEDCLWKARLIKKGETFQIVGEG